MTDTRSSRIALLWLLAALVHGCLVLLVTNRFVPPVAVIVLLCVPLLIIFLPIAVGQARGQLDELRKRLMWWHGLWGLITMSSIVFRMRSAESIRETPIDVWAAYRIALVGAVAFALLLRHISGQTQWSNSLFQGWVGALAVYASFSVASTFWSVYPAWTLYKSLEYLVDLALVAAILVQVRSTESFKSLFDWTWALCLVFLASVWVGVILWPAEAINHGVGLLGVQIHGVAPVISANSVGELSAALALVALARLNSGPAGKPRQAVYWLLLLVTGLTTLALSQTRTAVAGFLFGVATVLLAGRRVGTITFLIWITVLGWSLTDASDIAWAYFLRGQTQDTFHSLTGRTVWWAFGWSKFLERPIAGYGAYAGGRFTTMEELGAGMTATTHNTYLETLLGTGIIGLIPVVFALCGAWWTTVRTVRRMAPQSVEWRLALETLGVLSLVTFRSFFATALIWHPDLIFLLVLGYSEYLRRHGYGRLKGGVSRRRRC